MSKIFSIAIDAMGGDNSPDKTIGGVKIFLDKNRSQEDFVLNLFGKKPWEVPHLDTMELWKFGDYKHFTSIKLLAALFDIPTPKKDMDGGQVSRVYWQEKDLERIKSYCQKDTLTVAQLLLKYMGKPIISDNNIEVA